MAKTWRCDPKCIQCCRVLDVMFDYCTFRIVALDMGSEGAVKTLLGNEETVQVC